MKNNKNIFMFDCEAIELHGSTFAVGAIVQDQKGNEIDRFELLSKESLHKCVEWVKDNVIPSLEDMPTCETDLEMRNKFYDFYIKHKDTCQIYSDVNYPVETNFLAQVVQDKKEERQWNMPYPLYDASNTVPVDIDRNEKAKSGGLSLRPHNPLDDSIASLYCLLNK